jgi:hypothetical protein
MGEKLLPTLPPEQTDLSNYENEVEDLIVKEKIDPKDLEQVDSGPLAEANILRNEVKEETKTGPGEIKKKEQEAHSTISQELAVDEKSTRDKIINQRQGKLGSVKGTQETTKKKEEDKRKKITEDIQNIYKKAKDSVEKKLANLETTSLNQFDQGQEKASAKFENTVNNDMNAFKKERYSGPLGWTLKAKDWLLDMDDLPRVKQIFTDARNIFIGEIDTLIKTIIAGSKKVINQCKTEIQQAKDKIAGFVKTLEPELQKYAAQAQKEMTAKLDALDQQVNDKEKELKEKLDQRREQAIKAIDEKIAKMKEKLKGALSKLGSLIADAAMKLFKWALEKAGAPVEKIMAFLQKAASAFLNIIKSPGTFLGNLIDALTGGFKKFSSNILTHLKNGLMQWLFGAMAEAGITMPTEFSLKAIFALVLQVLGLTPDAIKMKVAKYIGEKNMERIEKVWEFISALISGGIGGLWEEIKEYFTNLKELVIDGIRDWVIAAIIKEAVQWLLSLFNPAGAIIKIAMTIYKIVMFIIERIRQIMAVVEAVIGSLSEIAAGAIGKAIDWIDKALGGLVSLAIGFLANLLGLGGISSAIRGIIDKARKPVHNALDKVIAKIASGIKTGAKKVAGKIAQWWKARKQFTTRGGESHTLFFEGSAENARLMIRSERKTFLQFVNQIQIAESDPKRDDKRNALQAARAKAAEIDSIKRRTKTEDGTRDQTKDFTDLLDELADYTKIFSGAGGGLPASSKPNYEMRNDFGSKMEIKVLSKIRPPGSDPGVTNPNWEALRMRLSPQGGRTYYVLGHLLSNKLGGPGTTWQNLAPLRQEDNQAHESSVERPIKDGTEEGKVFKYTVDTIQGSQVHGGDVNEADVAPGQDVEMVRRVRQAEQHIPRAFQCNASELDENTLEPKSGGISIGMSILNQVDTNIAHYNVTRGNCPGKKNEA